MIQPGVGPSARSPSDDATNGDEADAAADAWPAGLMAAPARPVILLASTCAWPSIPKLAVALAKANCEVVSIAPSHHPLNLTLAVSRRFAYRATRPLRSLEKAIARTTPDMIIACDERAVEHLHRLHARTADEWVRRLVERSLGRPDAYALTTSRQSLITLAMQLGLSAPLTRQVDTLADLGAWGEAEPLPWVLKVDGSWGGLGVRVVRTRAEADRAFRDLSRSVRPLFALRQATLGRDLFWLAPWLHQPPSKVTVQRYIDGRPANCMIAAWAGEALCGIAVDVVSSEGATGAALVIRPVDDPAMLDIGAQIVRALGMSGMIGFDFVIESGTGRPYLLEMNPRATGTSHLRLGPGRDPIGALTARLNGRPPQDRPTDTQRETIALFPMANLHHRGRPILETAYQDTPAQEPRLVRALLRRRVSKRATPSLAPDWAEMF
jgi:hypothetical protein